MQETKKEITVRFFGGKREWEVRKTWFYGNPIEFYTTGDWEVDFQGPSFGARVSEGGVDYGHFPTLSEALKFVEGSSQAEKLDLTKEQP